MQIYFLQVLPPENCYTNNTFYSKSQRGRALPEHKIQMHNAPTA